MPTHTALLAASVNGDTTTWWLVIPCFAVLLLATTGAIVTARRARHNSEPRYRRHPQP